MYSSLKIGLPIGAILLAAGSLAGAAEPGSFGYGRVATPAHSTRNQSSPDTQVVPA